MSLRRAASAGLRAVIQRQSNSTFRIVADESWSSLPRQWEVLSQQGRYGNQSREGFDWCWYRQLTHVTVSTQQHPATTPSTENRDATLSSRQATFANGGRVGTSVNEITPHVAGSSTAAIDVGQAAEQCDRILVDLKELRGKAERKKQQQRKRAAPPGWFVSLRQNVVVGLKATSAGTAAAAKWSVALPGRIAAFYRLPKAERRETYKGWWLTVKKEARHYWVGTKLLAADVQIAIRLVNKVLHGKQLTRRERRQLTRTSADIFRMVPLLVFVLVPFMELLLPVALKLFPNLLPSTFEDKMKAEEEMKKKVAAKLEVAKFLQDTVSEMAKDMRSSKSGATAASAGELYQFMKRVRAGEPVSNAEITRFAQLFNDELTLDNLDRSHLINLCRFVGIQPFGTDAFLVTRLRAHLGSIKADDRAIKEEGLDSLTEDELRQACRARGMRAPYGEGAVPFMSRQMEEWLDLSLNRALPSSLLLLSRAFTVTQPLAGLRPSREAQLDNLRDTLSALPNKVIEQVGLEEAAEGEEDVGRSYERKLEYLRREEELIREEQMEAEALMASETPTIMPSQSAREMTAATAAAVVMREAAASALAEGLLEGESQEEKSAKLAQAREDKMRKVISALAVLASSSGVSSEREAFMELVKKEIGRLNDQMAARGGVSMVFQAGGLKVERREEVPEGEGAARLAAKVGGILERIEAELDDVDARIGERLHVLDMDGDGLISKGELEIALGFMRDHLGEDDLRMLLERLNSFGEHEPIDVSRLMELAAPPEKVASAS